MLILYLPFESGRCRTGFLLVNKEALFADKVRLSHLTLVPSEGILRAEITFTYVLIYRFALIKCDAGKPDFDVFTRIISKEYEFVNG
jgi:hypothetical protein